MTRIKTRLKKISSSLYKKSLFFAILIVLVVVLIIISTLLLNIENDILKDYRQLVQTSLQNADSSFGQYVDSTQTYSINTYASTFGAMSRLDKEYTPAHISNIATEIHRMFRIMSYIQSVTVITRENEVTYSVFNGDYELLSNDFDSQLYERLNQIDNQQPFLWSVSSKYPKDEDSQLLCVFCRDAMPDSEFYRGTVAMNINLEVLSKLIFSDEADGNSFFILDSLGNVVVHTNPELCGENLMSEEYVTEIIQHGLKNGTFRIEGVDCEINAMESSVPGFYIVARTSSINDMVAGNRLIRVLITIALIVTVMSIIAGILIFRALFKSYNKIIEKTKKFDLIQIDHTSSDDDVNVLETFYDNTSQYIRELKENEHKNEIISGILKGQNVEHDLLKYHYFSKGSQYFMMILHISEINQDTPHISDYENVRENIAKCADSVLKDIVNPVFFTLSFNKILILININDYQSDLISENNDRIENLIDRLYDRFGYVSIGIGSPILSIQKEGMLIGQYKRAESIYMTARLINAKTPRWIPDCGDQNPELTEIAEKILESVTNNDREKYLCHVEYLLENLDGIEWSEFEEIVSDLIIRIVTNSSRTESAETEYVVRKKVEQIQSRDDLLSLFSDCFNQAENWMRVTVMNPSAPILERTVEYIDINYSNCNINLNTISDEFHISPAYLGKMFHEFTGMSFNDYLLKKRMEHAGTLLLLNPMEKIMAIAEKSGYANVTYFTTSFKNYYGVTPSKYKNLKPGFGRPSFEDEKGDTEGDE